MKPIYMQSKVTLQVFATLIHREPAKNKNKTLEISRNFYSSSSLLQQSSSINSLTTREDKGFMLAPCPDLDIHTLISAAQQSLKA